MRARSDPRLVTTARTLRADGVSRTQVAAELRAGRWRRAGLAIVLHNGPLSRPQQREVARVHAGPTAVFTAFTAAELVGLRGWEQDEVHLLAPGGTRVRPGSPVALRLHLTGTRPVREQGRLVEALPFALLRAAASWTTSRPGCGLLAAAVQQRRTTPEALEAALATATRTKFRAVLRAAVADIAGGSQALSEIDFVQLCRRHGLPEPVRQAVRLDSTGRRRFLDATWRRADGRLVVAEVDGALHLAPRYWWSDQLRQNELVLDDALVLRFPTVVVRTEEFVVARQLRRAILP